MNRWGYAVTSVLAVGLLMNVTGCVTSARHMGVVSALDSANQEIVRNRQQMAEVRNEVMEIKSLIRRLNVNRRTAQADMQQAMAALTNLQATVTDETDMVDQIDGRISKLADSLDSSGKVADSTK